MRSQSVFVKNCSATDTIHSVRMLAEKHQWRRRTVHLAFFDFGKAFDRVLRELLWLLLPPPGSGVNTSDGSSFFKRISRDQSVALLKHCHRLKSAEACTFTVSVHSIHIYNIKRSTIEATVHASVCRRCVDLHEYPVIAPARSVGMEN